VSAQALIMLLTLVSPQTKISSIHGAAGGSIREPWLRSSVGWWLRGERFVMTLAGVLQAFC
jgi:hypothetical protein